MNKILIVIIILVLVFVAVWFLVKNSNKPEDVGLNSTPSPENNLPLVSPNESIQNTDLSELSLSGTILAGNKSKLFDFNQSDYEKAIASNKLIVLYFYANWCPICKAEISHLYSAFNKLNDERVIGFRINFNDDATDDYEQGLAVKYGVPYQHTKLFIRNGEVLKKYPDSWGEGRYLNEIYSFLE